MGETFMPDGSKCSFRVETFYRYILAALLVLYLKIRIYCRTFLKPQKNFPFLHDTPSKILFYIFVG